MDIQELLRKVKSDEIDMKTAENLLKKLPYEELGFAKLDHHRKLRSGFGEVIYCSGKSDEHLLKIFQSFHEKGVSVLGTRASIDQFRFVHAALPKAEYDETSRIIKIMNEIPEKIGCIAVCSGGTSDIPVAEEAAQTAEFFGSNVLRIYDVGVAGIHRLFSKMAQE